MGNKNSKYQNIDTQLFDYESLIHHQESCMLF